MEEGNIFLSTSKLMSINFAKWLQHTDNGTEHYNPHTKEKTGSIGFSPYDCYVDGLKTVEELFELFLDYESVRLFKVVS